MNLRTLLIAAPLAVVMACGGSTSTTGTGSAALDAAIPSFAALSFDQVAEDAVAPAATPLAAPGTALSAAMADRIASATRTSSCASARWSSG